MDASKNRKLPTFIAIALIAIVVIISVLIGVFRGEDVSDKMAQLSEVYYAQEGTAAIVVDGRLTGVSAMMKSRHAYLPLKRITEEINDCFYYDRNANAILYTSALELVSATETTTYDEVPVFFDLEADQAEKKLPDEERIYVLLDYVAEHTDISLEYFTGPDRVFIRSVYGQTTYGLSAASAPLRVSADKKSEIITRLAEGLRIRLVSKEGDWYRACIGDKVGHAGYIFAEDVRNIETVEEHGDYREPEYTRLTIGEPVRLAWHQVFSDSGIQSLPSLMNTADDANVIVPTWFSVTSSDGTIISRANAEYVRLARENGKHVWALVENFNTTNKLDYAKLLGTAASRRRMVETLIYETMECGAEGINVDFEGLPSSAGDDYLQFLRELSVECRKAKLILSVDNYVPSPWTQFYNRKAQAEFVDYFMIMAYDEHYVGTDAGSTASIGFIQNGIEETIAEGVPAEKIVVGIPFFARLWTGEGSKLASETIGMRDMAAFRKAHEAATSWDDETEQYYTECTIDGKITRLWSESIESIEVKLEVIGRFGVCGVAGWKLGMETSDVWDAIGQSIR